MKKGLICYILKTPGFGDCSCNGVSNRFNKVLLVPNDVCPDVPEIFEESEDLPAVEVRKLGNKFNVIPCKEKSEGKWMMAGGCYITTSDGRFPFDYPVALHDRYEG